MKKEKNRTSVNKNNRYANKQKKNNISKKEIIKKILSINNKHYFFHK